MSAERIAELEELNQQLLQQLLEAEQLLSARGPSNTGLIRLDEAHSVLGVAMEDFSLEILLRNGWRPALTSMVKPNPYFAVLKAEEPNQGRLEFLVLCPSLSETPIHLDVARCATIDKL